MDVAQYLLEQNVDQSPNSTHGTPLCIAAAMGRDDLVQMLLLYQASVHEQSLTLGSPLHAACHSGSTTVVERLLRAGAPIACERQVRDDFVADLRSREDKTPAASAHRLHPVHVAAGEGHIEVLRLLVQQGANVDAVCSCWNVSTSLSAPVDARRDSPFYAGRTALMQAVCFSKNTIAGELIGLSADVDLQDAAGLTALALAAQHDNRNGVQMLLSAGANTALPDRDGRRAVDHAISAGHAECLQHLMQAGADVSRGRQVSDGNLGQQSTIELAVFSGQAEIVKILAQHMPVKGYHPSLLHQAVRQGFGNVAQALIDAGINVDIKDHDGNTPLHYAAYYDQAGVARVLIANGADIWRENSHKGRFPLRGNRTLTDIVSLPTAEGTRFPFGNAAEIAENQSHMEMAQICKGGGSRGKKQKAGVRRKGEFGLAIFCCFCAPCYAVGKWMEII